jgi:hypothetical protein
MRLVFAGVFLLSMAYGVIAYVPFTYAQVIEGKLSDGLLAFAAAQPLFVWIACVALVVAVWNRLRRKERGAWLLLTALLATAVWLTVHPLLASLKNEPRSLWIGLAMTIPVLWLAGLDLANGRRRTVWADVTNVGAVDARMWWACLVASVVMWLLYAGIAWSRGGPSALVAELLWSLPAHLTLFAGIFVVAMLTAGAALTTRRTAEVEFWLGAAVIWIGLVLLIQQVILRPLSFLGGQAWLTSCLVSASVTGIWSGLALQLRADARVPAERGLDALFAPSGRTRPLWRLALLLAGVAAVGTLATARMAAMDWNFLGQEVIAAALWLVTLALVYGALTPTRVRASSGIALACIAPTFFAVVVTHMDPAQANRAATVDPSFRLLNSALVPTLETAVANDGLYEFLLANTNLPHEQPVEPLNVEFVPSLTRTTAPLPHVFIVVVDSLRRDYVAPFNPDVTFTPRLAAFANDGTAFTNAFSRYGATGLSEPSIWVGGMLLHKQYVEPFAPQNALAKLLAAEDYTPFVSVDSILKVILPADQPRLIELDRGRATKDYTLCASLSELQQDLTTATAPRMFAYTQAQDVHISTITRENTSVPGGGAYPGFYPPYAARVARFDTCFGTFIDALKSTGLYDSSIVIFTADHGDSLGEEGRFGHAYTVFPEVMRIPLIIKLPGDQSRLTPNRNAVVFSSDITPTLYDLLGHAPTLRGFPFGQSLASGAIRPTDGELVASSYGAVYGWLTGNGRRLYIADSINFRDYVYDLVGAPGGTRVTGAPGEHERSRAAIRERVAEIARVYGYTPR